MKLVRLYALLLIILMSTGILLTGCSNVKASSGDITVNLGDEPATLDPQLAFDVIPMRIINSMFEGLCRKDKDGKPVPGIAKSWDISGDRLTYTFYLRDAKWWDGSDITATDFKNAWLRALDPAPKSHEPSYMGHLLFCIKGAEGYSYGGGKKEDVQVFDKDSKTLVVNLVNPTPYFLDLICSSVFMPQNTDFFNSQPDENNVTKYGAEMENIIGNGPFRIKEWNHNESIILEKNEDYWNSDNIKLDMITFKMINDNSSSVTSFNAGEINVVDITNPAGKKELEKKGVIKSYNVGATQYITINNEDPVLKNVNIRKALSYAIDRQTLVEKLINDGSEQAYGFVNPVVRGIVGTFREDSGDLFNYDTANAKILLNKGLEELGIKALPKLSIMIDDKETSKRDAQAFQDMWRKTLSIEVEILTMPFDAMTEKMMQKDYQLALLMWTGDYNDPTAFLDIFESKNFFNVAYYNNQNFDGLLERCKSELDKDIRMGMLMEAERMVIDDMVVAPVYFLHQSYAVSKNIKDFVRGNSAIQDMDFYWTYTE
jgi:oligopeptide transport system substrate-binding protein